MEERANRYFLENWLRGAKNDILDGRFEDLDSSHPHITFVRPFTIPPGDEEKLKDAIVDYCKDKKPIGFKLKGVGYFPNGINYIPVYSQELLEFNNGLEKVLGGHVIFDEKLADEKTLHLTVTAGGMEEFPDKDFVMLRLTCIKNKKILFSYDLEMSCVLNREQSLDRWHWRFTRALYEDRLEPGKKSDLRKEIIEAISDFEGDPEYFAGVATDFGFHARVQGLKQEDMEFFEELSPKIYMGFDRYIRMYVNSPENIKKSNFNDLLAHLLFSASEIAVFAKDQNVSAEFKALLEYVKPKQSDQGIGLMKHMFYKAGYSDFYDTRK